MQKILLIVFPNYLQEGLYIIEVEKKDGMKLFKKLLVR